MRAGSADASYESTKKKDSNPPSLSEKAILYDEDAIMTRTRMFYEGKNADSQYSTFVFTVNGKGYSVRATPCAGDGMTWGLWDIELSKPGDRTVRVKACDFASGTDVPCGKGGDLFSIWF